MNLFAHTPRTSPASLSASAPALPEAAVTGLAALAAPVHGPVLRPGDDGYDEERSGFQTGHRHRPAVIVGAAGAADVRAAVAFAAAHGLSVAVQATGHGLGAATEGGLLITTRRMTGLRVDAAARTAWAAAGVVWAQVIEEAARHGLAPLSGSAPAVGVVGYTLGGGLGLLAREFGYAAEHVRAVELVTADARELRVTADSDPDLFWALLGGGHGLGVVTGMEFGLVPVRRLYGGQLVFGADLIDAALGAYLDWTRDLPNALTSSLGILVYPDIPQLPEPLRGRHLLTVRVAYTGSVEDGERLVAPLRAVGPRVSDTLREMPYTQSHTIHADPDTPRAYDGDNALLTDLDPDTLREAAALAGPGAPFMCVFQLNHLGGALATPAAGPTDAADSPRPGSAVGHRDARYLLRVSSPVDGTDREAVRALHARILGLTAPYRIGRNINMLFGDHDPRTVRDAYEPPTYERLTKLKATHDPAGLFRTDK
ncbi:FAD-binding protein [Streptomyces sp. MST-110588]|uniref:FAD-binding oxidoreductase n=1 Tax=Streptomyces sp. MST-110588 TaxID=2833628 RepID=UPI001F5D5CEA|nr:FAD-binding protein [Streptomyces sp. MST-110588]UNO40394.1 FAD-binding oxidoreductase [Streptomyces sp. MST-110588]